MSKRAGDIVTLDEILDEVGVDAARFFFIMPALESPLTFDLKLAVEKDEREPRLLRAVRPRAHRLGAAPRAAGRRARPRANAALALADPSDRSSRWPAGSPSFQASSRASSSTSRRIGSRATRATSPRTFISFYTECKILTDDARRAPGASGALPRARRRVLARALALAGVSAPDSM